MKSTKIVTGTKIKRLRSLAALPFVATALLVAPGVGQAGTCSSQQRAALEVKSFQTEMMVAALSCGNRADYNEFVTKFKPHLAPLGSSLKGLFLSTYGNGGMKQMDAFVTNLANVSSQRHMNDTTGFCAQAAGDFATLAQINDPGGLLELAHQRTGGVTGVSLPCAMEQADASANPSTKGEVASSQQQ